MKKEIEVRGFGVGDTIYVVSTNGLIESCIVHDIMVETFMVFEGQTIGIVFFDGEGKQRLMKISDEVIFTDEKKALKYANKVEIQEIKRKIKLNSENAKAYKQSAKELKEMLLELKQFKG